MEHFFTMISHKLQTIILVLEKMKSVGLNSSIKSSLEAVLIDGLFVDVHTIMYNNITTMLSQVEAFSSRPITDEWEDERFYFLNFKPLFDAFIKSISNCLIPTIATSKSPDELIGIIKILNDIIVRGNQTFGLCLDNYSPEVKQQILLNQCCIKKELAETINNLNSEKE